MWYPKCKPGYHAFGCCICVKDGDPSPPGKPDALPGTPDGPELPKPLPG